MRWATGLSGLLFLPFDRALTQTRVARLQDRYLTSLERLRTPAVGQRRPALRLLHAHPTALKEAEQVGPVELESRLQRVVAELQALAHGAPLPAPVGATERAQILALADAEVFLIHLKVRSHLLKGMRPEARRDPTWRPPMPADLPPLGLDPSGLASVHEAYLQIPRSERHRHVLTVAGLRHQVPDLAEWLLPPAQNAPSEDHGFAVVGPAAELKEGQGKRYDHRGVTVAVFRQGDRLYALDDTCPHRGGPLGKGDLEDGCVACPLHGWAFSLETGAMRGNPQVKVDCYQVKVEDGQIALGGKVKRG